MPEQADQSTDDWRIRGNKDGALEDGSAHTPLLTFPSAHRNPTEVTEENFSQLVLYTIEEQSSVKRIQTYEDYQRLTDPSQGGSETTRAQIFFLTQVDSKACYVSHYPYGVRTDFSDSGRRASLTQGETGAAFQILDKDPDEYRYNHSRQIRTFRGRLQKARFVNEETIVNPVLHGDDDNDNVYALADAQTKLPLYGATELFQINHLRRESTFESPDQDEAESGHGSSPGTPQKARLSGKKSSSAMSATTTGSDGSDEDQPLITDHSITPNKSRHGGRPVIIFKKGPSRFWFTVQAWLYDSEIHDVSAWSKLGKNKRVHGKRTGMLNIHRPRGHTLGPMVLSGAIAAVFAEAMLQNLIVSLEQMADRANVSLAMINITSSPLGEQDAQTLVNLLEANRNALLITPAIASTVLATWYGFQTMLSAVDAVTTFRMRRRRQPDERPLAATIQALLYLPNGENRGLGMGFSFTAILTLLTYFWSQAEPGFTQLNTPGDADDPEHARAVMNLLSENCRNLMIFLASEPAALSLALAVATILMFLVPQPKPQAALKPRAPASLSAV